MTAFHGVNGTGTEADSRRPSEEMERLRARVNRQVRRFGFTDAEEADQVVDDILDAWSRFAFDTEKANGAKPERPLKRAEAVEILHNIRWFGELLMLGMNGGGGM